MNRNFVREFTHNAKEFLNPKNSEYKQWIFRYTFLELEKDLGPSGDITTNALFGHEKMSKAQVIAREDGVLAGAQEIKYFLVDGDTNFRPNACGEFKIDFKFEDGEKFKKDDVVMEIEAKVRDLLSVERVVLNLLMRMSGVATFTKLVCDMVKDYGVLIVPTRKTLWGLLDKRAVALGGGGTHRLNMSDAILIKDTHLDLFGRDVKKVLEEVIGKMEENPPRFIEIEVTSEHEALAGARVFSNSKIKSVGVLLMDNVEPETIESAIANLKNEGLHENVLVEASGGINEKNVVDYAKTGVDIISMGSITNGPRSLNMSLKIVK